MATQKGKPHFFRLLYPDPFSNLPIPRKFYKHFDLSNPKKATLLSPCGNSWQVNIEKYGEDLYFTKGWLEFSKAHNLEIGFCLIFRYEGKMVFNVEILDSTQCSKDYPQILTEHSEVAPKFKLQVPNVEERRNSNSKHRAQSKQVQIISPEFTSKPQFEKILPPSSLDKTLLCIPKAFCVENGLSGYIFLKNLKGKKLWRFIYVLDNMPQNFEEGGLILRKKMALK